MPDPADVRKRILFIACTLGVMAGVTGYLAYKVAISENFALLAIAPAVLLTCIPMVNALRRLLAQRRQAGDARDAA